MILLTALQAQVNRIGGRNLIEIGLTEQEEIKKAGVSAFEVYFVSDHPGFSKATELGREYLVCRREFDKEGRMTTEQYIDPLPVHARGYFNKDESGFFEYDKDGLLTSSKTESVDPLHGLKTETNYYYDKEKRLTKKEIRLTTSWLADTVWNELTTKYQEEFTYDKEGNQTGYSVVYPKSPESNRKTSIEYDKKGRKTKEEIRQKEALTLSRTYTYDPKGKLLEDKSIYYKGGAWNAEKILTYTYDKKGFQLSQKHSEVKGEPKDTSIVNYIEYQPTEKGEMARKIINPNVNGDRAELDLAWLYNERGQVIQEQADGHGFYYKFTYNDQKLLEEQRAVDVDGEDGAEDVLFFKMITRYKYY